MVFISELLDEKEIIFPEIAAITIGCILSEKLSWNCSMKRMIILISLCAVLGVSIVLYLPLSYFLQIIIAFTLSQLILFFSGTTFTPLTSAIVLPVVLKTSSWVYPLAAFSLTSFIALLRVILIKTKVRKYKKYKADSIKLNKLKVITFFYRISFVAIFAFIAVNTDNILCIAPPLLVAFLAFTTKGNITVQQPFKVIFLIFLSAFAGAFSRYVFTLCLHLPITISVAFAAAVMIFLVRVFNMKLPPAGAVVLLAMLIKKEAIISYPVKIVAGTVVLMITGLLYQKIVKKIN
ncbi:MAG: HPP family protein [Treponema sp.]|nr:HPP family protein [Treponema sp.]